MYCSDRSDDLLNYYESKENVDLTNINVNKRKISAISCKENEECDKNIFVFNSGADDSVDSLCNRGKRKLSNESITSRTENSETDTVTNLNWKRKVIRESPVWCMDFCNDLIILGCADGRLEFWEASSGKLMVSTHHQQTFLI